MTTTTNTMNDALKSRLAQLGHKDPEALLWGRRVVGDVGGVVIERDGKEKWYSGPFVAVHGGDQVAIVRFN